MEEPKRKTASAATRFSPPSQLRFAISFAPQSLKRIDRVLKRSFHEFRERASEKSALTTLVILLSTSSKIFSTLSRSRFNELPENLKKTSRLERWLQTPKGTFA